MEGSPEGRGLRGRGQGASRGGVNREGRGSRAEDVIKGKQDTARIHLWVQLAERRARPAEQTQLQARQQSQGQKPVRDLKRGAQGGRAGVSPLPSQALSPRDPAAGCHPLARTCARPSPSPARPTHSPWDSRAAGTPGSRERPAAAGTPPARGAARPPVSPAATSSLLLPPPGPTRPG